MLEESFIFFEGIRQTTEKKIWSQGISNWSGYMSCQVKGISSKKKSFHIKQIGSLKKAIKEKNETELEKFIAKKDSWRLYDLLKDQALFLDIETTYRNDITVIGAFDGQNQHFFVKGRNMDKYNFEKLVDECKIIVTFNGRSFDIPIIEKYFGIKIKKPHIDLRHVLSQIGYFGGLKKIEKELGIVRPKEITETDGGDAVLLWNSYVITEDEEFLMKLLLYNEQDCVNLKTLADFAIPKLWKEVRFK